MPCFLSQKSRFFLIVRAVVIIRRDANAEDLLRSRAAQHARTCRHSGSRRDDIIYQKDGFPFDFHSLFANVRGICSSYAFLDRKEFLRRCKGAVFAVKQTRIRQRQLTRQRSCEQLCLITPVLQICRTPPWHVANDHGIGIGSFLLHHPFYFLRKSFCAKLEQPRRARALDCKDQPILYRHLHAVTVIYALAKCRAPRAFHRACHATAFLDRLATMLAGLQRFAFPQLLTVGTKGTLVNLVPIQEPAASDALGREQQFSDLHDCSLRTRYRSPV